MSALVNFTVAPIIAHGISTLPIIPLDRGFQAMDSNSSSSSLGIVGFRSPRTSGRAQHLRTDRERQSRQLFLEAEREKRRRSVNIPAYHKPKDARLINTSRNRCVEVQDDGTVRTSGLLNSLHAVFEVVFWCHVLPFFKSCSHSLESTPISSMTESSTFSTILLRYKASNRYLCMDKRGKIYSLPLPVDTSNYSQLEECVFQSAYLSNQYDVYYSRHYPRNTDKCRAGPVGDGRTGKRARTCRNHWYLGVDKQGTVRTIKTPETKMKQNTFFITRWVHEQKGQSLPDYRHPLSPTSPLSSPLPEEGDIPPSTAAPGGGSGGGLFEVKPPPPRRPKSVFSILFGHKRNSFGHRTFRLDASGDSSSSGSRSGCINLLGNCEVVPDEDDKRSNYAFSRTLTPRQVTRERSETDDSQQ